MPQNKFTILSTRSLPEQHLSTAFEKGFLVEVVSFIKTEPLSSDEVVHKIDEALDSSSTIIFTSAKAVEAVAKNMKAKKNNWMVFCIEHGTLAAAEKYFGKASIAATALDAASLAEKLLNLKIKEACFFCGDQRMDELPNQLRSKSVNVQEVVVYRTISTPMKIEKVYDGILFFSPSGVKSFFELNALHSETVLFAIGATTAESLKTFSKNKTLISRSTSRTGVLDEAIAYFENEKIHH